MAKARSTVGDGKAAFPIGAARDRPQGRKGELEIVVSSSMKPKREIPWRNKTPYGWWIASYVERFEWKADRQPTNRSKRLCWENTVILKAKNREVAFRKANVLAKRSATGKWALHGDPPGRPGRWVLEGLTSLLPIYEPLEDGAEVLWSEYRNKTLGTLRRRIKPKGKLEAFED